MRIWIPEIPAEYLEALRNEGLDAQAQAPRRVRAEGGEPCRDVLRRARPGEELLLGSFCPFSKPGPYREFGPVFVLARASDEPVDRRTLPITAEGDSYLGSHFVLRGYDADESIVSGALVEAEEAPPALRELLELPGVEFVHARFPVFGCFACRVEPLD